MSYSAPNVVGYPPGIASIGTLSAVDQRHGAAASATWPTANLAIYVPVCLPRPVVVVKLALHNGGAVSGNFDVGIYTAAGSRVISTGSTAQAGTTTEQIVDVTDTLLAAGLYYFAACLDNTTGAVYRTSLAAPIALANGVLSEALGSVTLPATATWTADQTLAYIPAVSVFVEATAA